MPKDVIKDYQFGNKTSGKDIYNSINGENKFSSKNNTLVENNITDSNYRINLNNKESKFTDGKGNLSHQIINSRVSKENINTNINDDIRDISSYSNGTISYPNNNYSQRLNTSNKNFENQIKSNDSSPTNEQPNSQLFNKYALNNYNSSGQVQNNNNYDRNDNYNNGDYAIGNYNPFGGGNVNPNNNPSQFGQLNQ
jgi:hypothetical protein